MSPSNRLLAAIICVFVLTGLACGPLSGLTGQGATEVPIEQAEVTTEAAPTEKPTPTEVPPTNTPAPTPTPESRAISSDNARNIQEVRLIPISGTPVLVTAFSPVSHEFATLGFDKVIRIWDADSGQLIRELSGLTEYGFAMEYSPDGTRLATGTDDYRLRIWDPARGDLLQTVVVGAQIYQTAWSPDGSRVAISGFGSSRFQVIDPETGAELVSLQPSQRQIWSVDFSPDGRFLAAASDRGGVTIYDAKSYAQITVLTDGQGAVWDVDFSPNNTLLATCNDGGGVYIWRTNDWSLLHHLEAHTGECSGSVFALGSDVYFTVGRDGFLRAWNAENGAMLREIGFGRFAWRISISGDGELLAVAVDDGTARVIGLPGK